MRPRLVGFTLLIDPVAEEPPVDLGVMTIVAVLVPSSILGVVGPVLAVRPRGEDRLA
jgi:hypothetical protein